MDKTETLCRAGLPDAGLGDRPRPAKTSYARKLVTV